MALELPPHGGTARGGQGQSGRHVLMNVWKGEINGAFLVFIMWFNDAILLIKRTFFNSYTFIYRWPQHRGKPSGPIQTSLFSPTHSAGGFLLHCDGWFQFGIFLHRASSECNPYPPNTHTHTHMHTHTHTHTHTRMHVQMHRHTLTVSTSREAVSNIHKAAI